LHVSSVDVADLDAFLSGLEMQALVRPFNEDDLPRIAELVAKSNQFNLTTQRHTLSRLREMGADGAGVCFTIRLRDRLVDHGLIAVVAGTPAERRLEIDTWVMSCRVLKRGVEAITLQELCERAHKNGYHRLRGMYRPTERNGMVRTLYRDLGFAPDREPDSWFLTLPSSHERTCHIGRVESFHG
jgi:FkbH-like protein